MVTSLSREGGGVLTSRMHMELDEDIKAPLLRAFRSPRSRHNTSMTCIRRKLPLTAYDTENVTFRALGTTRNLVCWPHQDIQRYPTSTTSQYHHI
ncbi:hypothetical protein PIIN_02130 [Serendipita indica DSM 11827]|uniref:Uncharacterized protein n=1 Tax=Serendipita indica (strain DSM 11827) TaxID=1109443 RepID=G4TAC1_SERID|nr:hypothetical protein PIIN_02130 [Serendipita indica DSM 11827]